MGEPPRTDLEYLWSGPFGDEYTERNAAADEARGPFWARLLQAYEPRSVLEVGCNLGGNLRWIVEWVDPRFVVGVDVNESALARLRERDPRANALYASGLDLPFRDGAFDLVFTMGVLIHIGTDDLATAMSEIVRCSGRYVLCGEYFAAEETPVEYRGEIGALFKRDYGSLYASRFPELELVEKGFLGRDEGWDDVTWWLFRRA
jgi:pseudaminic acid biosynthesis-associated methylase